MEEEEEFIEYANSKKVPKVFWSDLTGEPFTHCSMCETYLLEEGTQYLIEKAIKRYRGKEITDTIFELAICMDCFQQMRTVISEESKQKMEVYFSENVDWTSRMIKLFNNTNEKDWLDHCLVTGQKASDGGEYQIYAHCDGDEMMFHQTPYMLRGEILEELIHLLSKPTLDELNRFSKEFTSGPPEFKEILDSGPRVFL